MFPFQGGRKFLVASHQGRGFIVAEDECLGTTRKGKQVLNVKAPDEARAVALLEGEQVATHRREPQDGDLPASSNCPR